MIDFSPHAVDVGSGEVLSFVESNESPPHLQSFLPSYRGSGIGVCGVKKLCLALLGLPRLRHPFGRLSESITKRFPFLIVSLFSRVVILDKSSEWKCCSYWAYIFSFGKNPMSVRRDPLPTAARKWFGSGMP